jgi:exodeoxyribonuclease VII small subunit
LKKPKAKRGLDMAATRKKKATQTESPQDEATFDELMGRLEGLVKKLEDGQLSLEESLVAYEEGVGLVRNAQGRLSTMEGRLEKLMSDGQTAPLAEPSDQKAPPAAAPASDDLPF